MSDQPQAPSERTYDVELRKCVTKGCSGELIELMYDESINWITVVYKCPRCGRDFTLKIEL